MVPNDSTVNLAELNTRIIQHATTLLTKALEAGLSGQSQVQVAIAHQVLDQLELYPQLARATYLRPLLNMAWDSHPAKIAEPTAAEMADALLATNLSVVGHGLLSCLPDGVAVHTPANRLCAAERYINCFHSHTATALKAIASQRRTEEDAKAPL